MADVPPSHRAANVTSRGLSDAILASYSFFTMVDAEDGDHWRRFMKIPNRFVSKCTEDLTCNGNVVILSTIHGSWSVRVLFLRPSLCVFKVGWAEFVRDNNVMEGNLLAFQRTGPGEFTMTIFDLSACSSIVMPPFSAQEPWIHPLPAALEFSNVDTVFEEILTLGAYDKYNVTLPADFMDGSGLAKLNSIRIYNDEGIFWAVPIKRRGRRFVSAKECGAPFVIDDPVYEGWGWSDFYIAIGLPP